MKILSPRPILLVLLAGFVLTVAVSNVARSQTTISVTDSSSSFTPILGINGSILTDAALDQQTGQPFADFVGNATDPAFMIKYGLLGGNEALAFRVRLNSYNSNLSQLSVLRIGFDADVSGNVDLSFGITTASGGNRIDFFRLNGGATANVSPTTTSLSALPTSLSVSATSTVFRYEAVENLFSNGGNSSSDVNDALMTFILTFNQLNAALASINVPTIGARSALLFVATTSTQNNTVNQDAIGYGNLNVSANSSLRYDQVVQRVFADTSPIPEPSTWVGTGAMLLTGLSLLWWRRRGVVSPPSGNG